MERPRRIWENNIEIHVTEIGCKGVECVRVAQDDGNKASGTITAVDFLTSWIISAQEDQVPWSSSLQHNGGSWAQLHFDHKPLCCTISNKTCVTCSLPHHNWGCFSFISRPNLHPSASVNEHPLYMTSNFLVLMMKEVREHTPPRSISDRSTVKLLNGASENKI